MLSANKISNICSVKECTGIETVKIKKSCFYSSSLQPKNVKPFAALILLIADISFFRTRSYHYSLKNILASNELKNERGKSNNVQI